MTANEIFGNRLTELLKERKMSEYWLAKEVGVERATVCRWRSGKAIPSATIIVKVADVFGVSPEYLVGMRDDPKMEATFTVPSEECDEVFVLTLWGCLCSVLADYNVDVSHITPKMGEHMVEDFFEQMVKAGHIGKREE